MTIDDMDDTQYALLFRVRRSIRYHDRRRAFFEVLHRITSVLTILIAGSILFEIGSDQTMTAFWLTGLSVIAAVLAAVDMVIGYASHAALHRDLKVRFCDLETEILIGGESSAEWDKYQASVLRIERDEPPIYRALDLLCRDEVLVAEGFMKDGQDVSQFSKLPFFTRLTSHLYSWPNIAAGNGRSY